MPRATLNGITLAESDRTVIVEGNHYFPSESVNRDLFRESETTTHCLWKGDASYLSVEADGARVEDAAWYYPEPNAGGGEHQGPRGLLRQQGRGRGPGARAAVAEASSVAWGGGERRSAMMNGELRRQREAAERLDAAARESYRAAVDRAFEMQKDGMKLSRAFFQNWVETLEEGAEINRCALEDLQRLAAEQRQVFYGLSRESLDAYDGFLDSLAAYDEEVSGGRKPDRGN